MCCWVVQLLARWWCALDDHLWTIPSRVSWKHPFGRTCFGCICRILDWLIVTLCAACAKCGEEEQTWLN